MFERLNENIEAGNHWKHTGEMIYCEGAEEYLSIKEWQKSISYQDDNNYLAQSILIASFF